MSIRIESNKKLDNDSSKMANNNDIKEEKDISASIKKEKKDFGIDDNEKEKLSAKVGSLNYLNYHSTYMTNKKIDLESFKTPSQNLDSKKWLENEIKLEKEAKDRIFGPNTGNFCKRRHISRNGSGSIQNIEPVIELVPPVIKTEVSEIRTIKRTSKKDHRIVDITRKTRALINKHKSATITLPRVTTSSVPQVEEKEQDFKEHRTLSLNNDSTPQRSEGFEELDIPTEPEESTPSEETITYSPTTDSALRTDKVIKVKAPQALGIHLHDVLQDAQNISTDDVLKISHLSQIRSGNDSSRIAEICELYPIFFTPEVRSYICQLVNIVYSLATELPSDGVSDQERDDTFYILSAENRSSEFVKVFNRILKVDDIGSNPELLKKIIPILYLHIDKAFKTLRPEENFDYRKVMKQMFNAQSFICKHDVILEMSKEMFQKAISTFNRWLDDIFIECDISEILEPGLPVESAVNFNYSVCPSCLKEYPICFGCKDLLRCPCSIQDNQTEVIDGGLNSLNACEAHSIMGSIWCELEEEWREEEAKDHDVSLYTALCMNKSCSNKGTWLCVCKKQIYCSQSCKDEDWFDRHYLTCPLRSEPSFCCPQEEEMDSS